MILVLSIPFDYYLVYNISWCFVLFSLSIYIYTTSFFIKSIKIIQIINPGASHIIFHMIYDWHAHGHAQYGVCLRNENVLFFPNFHLYRHKTFENK